MKKIFLLFAVLLAIASFQTAFADEALINAPDNKLEKIGGGINEFEFFLHYTILRSSQWCGTSTLGATSGELCWYRNNGQLKVTFTPSSIATGYGAVACIRNNNNGEEKCASTPVGVGVTSTYEEADNGNMSPRWQLK